MELTLVVLKLRLRDRLHMWFLERVMDAVWRVPFLSDFYQRVGARLFAVAEGVGAVCVARGGHRAKDIPDRWSDKPGARRRFCQDCGLVIKVTDPVVSLEAFHDFTEGKQRNG